MNLVLGNRYEVLRELGRGGMGVVYLARDPLLDREVAVKVIPTGVLDAQLHERFRREARAVAKLDHPGVVGIYDFGSDAGSLYYVMPLVRGQNLRELATAETLALGEITDVSRQVAEALEYSHAGGIIHRDVKPENVMVTREGNGKLRARVTDFGLAMIARERRLTDTGMVVGTLAYLAPEQLVLQELDHRTDIYALGTMMYELLTGNVPFAGDFAGLVYRIVHDTARRPSELGISVPADVETLVMQCLEKDRERRPQRAQIVAETLARCAARLAGKSSGPDSLQNAILKAQQEATIEGILVVDREGKVLSYNRRFLEIWRIPEEVAASGDDNELLRYAAAAVENWDSFIELVNYLYQHPEEVRSDDRVPLKDGRILSRATLPILVDGQVQGRSWHFRDITGAAKPEKVHSESGQTIRPPQTARMNAAPRPSSPMIGRQKESATLHECLLRSKSEMSVVLIGGPAGIGKTRLLDELERLAGTQQIPTLRSAVAGVEHSLPYASICRIIEESLRLPNPPDISDLAPELTERFPLLRETPELRVHARTAPRDLPADRLAVFDLLARTFIRIAASQHVIIAVEDLQFGDVSVEALEHIGKRLTTTPVLLIGSYRTEEVDRTHPVASLVDAGRKSRHGTIIELGPLTIEGHEQLVASILGGNRLDQEVVLRTFEATEGNPHFAIELLRSLVESRELVQSESGLWRLASDAAISVDALPTTIHEAVERRLERLSERQRVVLSAASIAGRVFDGDELVSLMEEPASKLDADIDDLLASGYLREERHGRRNRFAFTSKVVRDVLYAAVPRRRRRSLHRALAGHLEQKYATRPERVAPQLLEHYARADVPEKVIEYGLSFARASLSAFAAQDAIRAAKIVLEFVDEDEISKAEARLVLAEALHLSGSTEAALPEIDAAVRIFDRLGDPLRACVAAAAAAEMAWHLQKSDETGRWVEKGLVYARRCGDDERRGTLLSLGATAANLRGHADIARTYLEELEELRPAIPAPRDAQRGGTLHVPFGYPLASIEPATTFSTWQAEVVALLFDTLTAIDDTARVVPRLAESFTVENHAQRYRFKLRDGVEFHDGRRLTAVDVRYSFSRFLRRADAGCRYLLQDVVGADAVIAGEAKEIEGVQVISPTELVIDLVRPLLPFAAELTYPALGIVPTGTEQLGDDWKSGYVGSGPFRLARFEPGRRVDLEANPRYWRSGVPRVDRLVISVGVRSEDIVSGFREGRFSLAHDLEPDDYNRLRRDREPGVRYAATPSLSTCFLALNSRRGPLRDRDLRARLLSSFDLDAVVARLGTLVLPAAGLFAPALLSGQKPRVLRVAKGKPTPAIHAPLRAGLFAVFATSYASVAQEVAEAIARSGLRVETAIPERRGIMGNTGFDLYFGRYYSDYPDTDGFAYGLLHSTAGILGQICGSDAVDKLLYRGRQETDPRVRVEIYRELEQHAYAESLILPLFHEQRYCFARPEVEGFGVRRFFPTVPYEEMSITRGR